jgi:hypothetical protein
METAISFAVVELDDGEQEFFDTPYQAFKFAQKAEQRKTHSVEFVAIGQFYSEDGRIYRGQQLRHLLRTLDNVQGWLKAQLDAELNANED